MTKFFLIQNTNGINPNHSLYFLVKFVSKLGTKIMSLFIQLKMGGWEPMLYRAFAKMGDVSNERTFFNER